MSPWREDALVFHCQGDRLLGIATVPARPAGTGILIVVGGPQYRSGSHRQFTLLARQLAGQGIASFRFDYRGMGDSEGEMRGFEHIDADIRAAIDAFMARVPGLRAVAIWGLCDAASAALCYGHTDPRVNGLILLNPWVHNQAAEARARLRHYYRARLANREFWGKLLRLELDARAVARELLGFVRLRCARPAPGPGQPGFVPRMLEGLQRFHGEVLILLSGQHDLTVQEFTHLIAREAPWREACRARGAARLSLDAANHTFSRSDWRDQVGHWTAGWVAERLAAHPLNPPDRPA